MTLWMRVLFTYQNMGITVKIQLLHFKPVFITLKSSERLAALQTALPVLGLNLNIIHRESTRMCTKTKNQRKHQEMGGGSEGG